MDLDDVTRALETLDGVGDVHHIHAWALTSGRYVLSAHIRVREEVDPQTVLSAANEMLKERFGFFLATLQVETACIDEGAAEAIDVTRRREGAR